MNKFIATMKNPQTVPQKLSLLLAVIASQFVFTYVVFFLPSAVAKNSSSLFGVTQSTQACLVSHASVFTGALMVLILISLVVGSVASSINLIRLRLSKTSIVS